MNYKIFFMCVLTMVLLGSAYAAPTFISHYCIADATSKGTNAIWSCNVVSTGTTVKTSQFIQSPNNNLLFWVNFGSNTTKNVTELINGNNLSSVNTVWSISGNNYYNGINSNNAAINTNTTNNNINEFTILITFKPIFNNTASSMYLLAADKSASEKDWYYSINNYGASSLTVSNSSGGEYTALNSSQIPTITNNTINHIALYFNRATKTFKSYFNGAYYTTNVLTLSDFPYTAGSPNINIGSRRGLTTFYRGYIYDIKIVNGSISDCEIYNDYINNVGSGNIIYSCPNQYAVNDIIYNIAAISDNSTIVLDTTSFNITNRESVTIDVCESGQKGLIMFAGYFILFATLCGVGIIILGIKGFFGDNFFDFKNISDWSVALAVGILILGVLVMVLSSPGLGC